MEREKQLVLMLNDNEKEFLMNQANDKNLDVSKYILLLAVAENEVIQIRMLINLLRKINKGFNGVKDKNYSCEIEHAIALNQEICDRLRTIYDLSCKSSQVML